MLPTAALPVPPSGYGGSPLILSAGHTSGLALLDSCAVMSGLKKVAVVLVSTVRCQLSGGVGCLYTALLFTLSLPLPANTLSVKQGSRVDAPAVYSSLQLMI